jgi:MerR family redox-sensitive transcriptional activator SoxR
MKIGDLAKRTGVNASSVRHYETRGLIAAPCCTGGQHRYFDDSVHRVLLIRFASDMGVTHGEIKLFLSGLRDKTPVGAGRNSLVGKSKRSLKRSSARDDSSRFSNTCSSATVPRSRSASNSSP